MNNDDKAILRFQNRHTRETCPRESGERVSRRDCCRVAVKNDPEDAYMEKYSKIRLALAVVFLFLSFNSVLIGITLNGKNQKLAPFVQRGLEARIAELEKDYAARGLRENVNKGDFDKGLSELKKNLVSIEQGEVFGILGLWLERIAVFLCFLMAVTFLINIILVLRRSPLFDACIKFSVFPVMAFAVFFYWAFLNQMAQTFQILEHIGKVAGMLQGAGNVQIINKYLMMRSVMFSPVVFIISAFFLLLYLGLPLGLYMWLKTRENKQQG
jgi:hypothetical protein